MAVTLPAFLYGAAVTTANRTIVVDVGGSDYTATMRLGDYLPGTIQSETNQELCTEVARALNAAGAPGRTFTCAYSHTTRLFTIAANDVFILRWSQSASTNAAQLLGFADSDTASAATHDSTSAAGAGNSSLTYWTPTDPIHTTTPVTAAADGTAATFLQRDVKAVQNVFDGGKVDTVYYATLREVEFQSRWLSGDDRSHMQSFLDWIERGRRFNYYPDKTSGNTLRLCLKNPGQILNTHEWLARPEQTFPPLRFIQQLSRT